MNGAARGVDLERWSAPAIGGLLLLALFAFWPTYLSGPRALGTPYTHLHALTATLWFVLLIVQPLLIRSGRRPLHRRLGHASCFLAPAVLVGIVLGAHSRLGSFVPELWNVGVYVLYLQIGLGAAFIAIWALGMKHREDRKVHARFMAATGLTFVDPVLARLLPSVPGVNGQVITFMVVNLILVGLIWAERDARRGRWAFPTVLGIFFAMEVPLWAGFTESSAWDAFGRWFLSLPLT